MNEGIFAIIGGAIGFFAAILYYELTHTYGDEAVGLVVSVPLAMFIGALLGWATFVVVHHE